MTNAVLKPGLIQLAENVWLFPHHPDPAKVQGAVGVVVAGEETYLIDASNSPRLARQIKQEIAQSDLPEVSYIIYSHYHWDHTFGACAFQVPVIAHTKCRMRLEEERQRHWGLQYLQSEIKRTPKRKMSFEALSRAMDDWDSFQIILPDITFDDTKVIQADQTTIELEHVGGEHAEDSIVIGVRPAGLLFVGDCFYPPPLHLRQMDATYSLAMLSKLAEMDYELYIESHDHPISKTELIQLIKEKRS